MWLVADVRVELVDYELGAGHLQRRPIFICSRSRPREGQDQAQKKFPVDLHGDRCGNKERTNEGYPFRLDQEGRSESPFIESC